MPVGLDKVLTMTNNSYTLTLDDSGRRVLINALTFYRDEQQERWPGKIDENAEAADKVLEQIREIQDRLG